MKTRLGGAYLWERKPWTAMARAFLELLDRLGVEGLKGKVVVGDAGYLYPELAGKVVQKGGRTSSS